MAAVPALKNPGGAEEDRPAIDFFRSQVFRPYRLVGARILLEIAVPPSFFANPES